MLSLHKYHQFPCSFLKLSNTVTLIALNLAFSVAMDIQNSNIETIETQHQHNYKQKSCQPAIQQYKEFDSIVLIKNKVNHTLLKQNTSLYKNRVKTLVINSFKRSLLYFPLTSL